MIKVAICGVAGRMGREVLKAVLAAEDTELCAAIDIFNDGLDAGTLLSGETLDVKITSNLAEALATSGAEVMVDFTDTRSVGANVITALKAGVRPVVGATGMSADDFAEVSKLAQNKRLGCIIAPNFTIGALLMIKFAAEAAKYFPNVEIIEKHHDQKLDAPSGTAIKTAEKIIEQRGDFQQGVVLEEEKIAGVRGGKMPGGLRIHSVRLPGFVAHQEVIFGDVGQTLTIRHDTTSRECFMPGVLMAIRKVLRLEGVVYGLENLLFE
ncbi:4-hydroxy-tetrahydrodipicolinate reductase [Sporotomaculum syntrophicum]|uniref:4-hydroxy-tetrahydrodipicolinate reductase n=1 Tax=Sporotomaculum syntrophicum TaxID=182264 RepID=A0A9D2WPL1_9FIRM|nr:4-hydroxy-tetrahydrodipicolinate reductase [Sporotomaculum syntrophicum]KAF1084586.1 4-hydroxy-tetrahydrodipicolinate reductase [Sporotomaculum syntrophicum]